MGLFDKIKKLIKNNEDVETEEFLSFTDTFKDVVVKTPEIKPKVSQDQDYIAPVLEEGVLATFDGVIDASSLANMERLKHNLKILISDAKKKGKVDKFVLIREDNFFPTDLEWRVLSNQTNLESVVTCFSNDLRIAYLLQQQGREPFIEFFGNQTLNASTAERNHLLSTTDSSITAPLIPSRFRSTKHYTINTALGYTGSYNFVETNRDFIVIDDIKNFLTSNYAYSVGYFDAYLDVTHEGLKISEEGIVLINEEKYDRIMSNPEIAQALSKRKVIRFRGDESLAISMVLTEMGVLPSRVGYMQDLYDDEIREILDSSIKALAEEHNLYHFKSHGGENGHFSDYYDGKNHDSQRVEDEFLDYICNKFPEYSACFPRSLRPENGSYYEFIAKVGVEKLFQAVQEYNEAAKLKMAEKFERYKKDRASITPEIHQIFIETVNLINEFYKVNSRHQSIEFENGVKQFFQASSVAEQLEAATIIKQQISELNIIQQNKTEIFPAEAVRTALDTVQIDKITEMDDVLLSQTIQRENEGVSINGE